VGIDNATPRTDHIALQRKSARGERSAEALPRNVVPTLGESVAISIVGTESHAGRKAQQLARMGDLRCMKNYEVRIGPVFSPLSDAVVAMWRKKTSSPLYSFSVLCFFFLSGGWCFFLFVALCRVERMRALSPQWRRRHRFVAEKCQSRLINCHKPRRNHPGERCGDYGRA